MIKIKKNDSKKFTMIKIIPETIKKKNNKNNKLTTLMKITKKNYYN